MAVEKRILLKVKVSWSMVVSCWACKGCWGCPTLPLAYILALVGLVCSWLGVGADNADQTRVKVRCFPLPLSNEARSLRRLGLGDDGRILVNY